jgi:hypothetical protein
VPPNVSESKLVPGLIKVESSIPLWWWGNISLSKWRRAHQSVSGKLCGTQGRPPSSKCSL